MWRIISPFINFRRACTVKAQRSLHHHPFSPYSLQMPRIRRVHAKKAEDHEELDQAEWDFLELCRSFGESDDENHTRQIGTVSPSSPAPDVIPQCASPNLDSLENYGDREDPPSIPSAQYVKERARKACERYYERFFKLIFDLNGCLDLLSLPRNRERGRERAQNNYQKYFFCVLNLQTDSILF